MKKGLTKLDWAVREYCEILWLIETGTFGAELARQEKHGEIAEILECNKELLSPVLHNIDYTKRDGYLWLNTACTLRRLKKQGMLKN